MKRIQNIQLYEIAKQTTLSDAIMNSPRFSVVLLNLPIRGGWGYTMEDPIIIDEGNPFKGVQLEHDIMRYRIHLELVTFQPEGKKYCSGTYNHNQHLLLNDGRAYDIFEVSGQCLFNPKFNNKPTSKWNFRTFWRSRYPKKYCYTTKYYFDVTSFYGSKLVTHELNTIAC